MNANEWIPVDVEKPEPDKYVLVQDIYGALYIGKLWQPDNFPKLFIDASTLYVTIGLAWQPLPELYEPKEV